MRGLAMKIEFIETTVFDKKPMCVCEIKYFIAKKLNLLHALEDNYNSSLFKESSCIFGQV